MERKVYQFGAIIFIKQGREIRISTVGKKKAQLLCRNAGQKFKPSIVRFSDYRALSSGWVLIGTFTVLYSQNESWASGGSGQSSFEPYK